ncbi:MAG: adenylate kinase [Lactobacillales bacterium]|jgi:adenylate kinase|nr:adenylate kinase [Lactobacillales bacterium]
MAQPATHLVIMGPPGSGKGTQAAVLSEKLGIKAISTGELLRAEVATGSKTGQKIDKLISKGKYVSDKIAIKLIEMELLKPENKKGYIFDGYPRTIAQAKYLDKLLKKRKFKSQALDKVIYLQVPDDYVVDRIIGRFQCATCGTLYHDKFKPTRVFGICDVCGGKEFTRREDDTFETVVSRLRTFRSVTAPIIPYYEEKGLLVCIDGTGPIDVVSEKIRKIVGY